LLLNDCVMSLVYSGVGFKGGFSKPFFRLFFKIGGNFWLEKRLFLVFSTFR